MNRTTSLWRVLPAALIAAGLLVWMAAPASAAFIIADTEDGNGADTHISNDSHQSAGTNHGGSASNSVRAITDSRAKLGVIRFDVSHLDHAYEDIRLQLELTFSTRTRTWNIYGLNDDGLDASSTADNWAEGSVTYNSTPGVIANPPTTLGNYALDVGASPGQLTLLTTMNVSAGVGVYTSTINAAFDAFINAAIASSDNNLVTLYAAFPSGTDSNPDWAFAAKEHTTALPPTLIAVPEPTSAVLALVALAAVGLRFRRR